MSNHLATRLVARVIDNAEEAYSFSGCDFCCGNADASLVAIGDENEAIIGALRAMVASARAEGRGLDALELGEDLARAEEHWPCP
jgi:hypothetical protein